MEWQPSHRSVYRAIVITSILVGDKAYEHSSAPLIERVADYLDSLYEADTLTTPTDTDFLSVKMT